MRTVRNNSPSTARPTPRGKPSAEDAAERAGLAAFRAFLRRRSLRATDMRDALALATLRRRGHFRVEDLAEDARAAGCEVSVATVYRALPLLVEARLIQPTDVSGDSRRYETVLGRPHHDHLVCVSCHAIVEFELDAFEVLQRDVAARHGYRLVGHVHELHGLCPSCVGREGQDTEPPKESA